MSILLLKCLRGEIHLAELADNRVPDHTERVNIRYSMKIKAEPTAISRTKTGLHLRPVLQIAVPSMTVRSV